MGAKFVVASVGVSVMPGRDKRSPNPPRCLDRFVTQPEELD